MLTINDLHAGVTIQEAGDPWVVLETDFMKKAQRRPVLRTKVKNLRTGAVKERTFKQSDSIPEAEVSKAKAQFLYLAGEQFVFMDQSTYEQYPLAHEVVGSAAPYLKEGLVVDLVTFQGTPVTVQLPTKLSLRVVVAPPGVRGDSATNILKEVELEGGLRAKVPLFVAEGDLVFVDTRTGEYVGKGGS